MKTFKLADTWISMVLILFFLALAWTNYFSIMYGYFVVGGWQVTSMFVHALNGWFTEKGGKRWFYHCIVGWILGIALVITFIIILFKDSLGDYFFLPVLMGLYALLFLSPFMAIYYSWLCYVEVYVKMKRPLDDLK